MKWIKHMTATRRDEKVARLVAKHGLEGYGLYWAVQEIIGEQMEGQSPACQVSYPVSVWANNLATPPQHVKTKLQWLAGLGLVSVTCSDGEILVSNAKLLKYRDEYSRKSGHAPEQLLPKKESKKKKESKRNTKDSPAAQEGDPRHTPCRELIDGYYRSKNLGIERAPWDGREAKALSQVLAASPDLSAERFRHLLGNRWKSEVNHAERPGLWLPKIMNYAGGPIDRFGQPLGGTNVAKGNGSSKGDRVIDASREAIAAIESRRRAHGDGVAEGGDPEREDAGTLRGEVVSVA